MNKQDSEILAYNRNLYRWVAIENTATMICAIAGCYFVSMWFLLLLLNIGSVKIKGK